MNKKQKQNNNIVRSTVPHVFCDFMGSYRARVPSHATSEHVGATAGNRSGGGSRSDHRQRGGCGEGGGEVTQTESDRHTEGRGASREEVWSLFCSEDAVASLSPSPSLARSLSCSPSEFDEPLSALISKLGSPPNSLTLIHVILIYICHHLATRDEHVYSLLPKHTHAHIYTHTQSIHQAVTRMWALLPDYFSLRCSHIPKCLF